MGLFRRKKHPFDAFPLLAVTSLLEEHGPYVGMVGGEPSAGTSSLAGSSNSLRLRLTPKLDMVFITTTEGIVVGFRDFGADVTDDMRVRTLPEILKEVGRFDESAAVILLVIGAHRYKYAKGSDQGFGNEELQRVCLEAMGQASISLAQALSRGESGIDLEMASSSHAPLFPVHPVNELVNDHHQLTHRCYVVSSLSHLGWRDELRNDVETWSFRHWLSPSLACDLREIDGHHSWTVLHKPDTETSGNLQRLAELTTPVEEVGAVGALLALKQQLLPKLTAMPWQLIAGGMFEEMAGILIDTAERRTNTVISLLQADAPDAEFTRFGDSTYESWDGP